MHANVIAVLDDDPTGPRRHDVADRARARRRGTAPGRADDVLLDQLALAAGGRGGGADRARRPPAVRAGPGRRDRQPQRLDAARARGRRGRGDRPRPPRVTAATTASCSRPRSSRPAATRAATSTTRATSRWGRRSSRATPRSATVPRTSGLRGREGRRRRAQPVAGRRAAAALSVRAVGRRQRRVLRRPRRGRARRRGSSGRRLLYRTGPSFVRALAGLEPMRAADRPRAPRRGTAWSWSARTSG